MGGGGTGHPIQPGWEIAQTYEAGGQPVKRLETRRAEEFIGEGPQTNVTETVTTTYYLYSSVLGAKVVELDGNGVKTKGYVYANEERLAKQEVNQSSGAVRWYYPNAETNSWVEEWDGGSSERQEMDPMGAELGTSDPYVNFVNPGYRDINPLPQMLYLEGGDPFDFSGGHTLDGVPIPQSEYNRLVGRNGRNGGMGFVDFGGYHLERIGEDTGDPRRNRYELSVWHSGSMVLSPLAQGRRTRRNRPEPQDPLPTHREVANLKPTAAQQRCIDYLARLFGGDGAKAGASGFTPSGDYRGPYTYNGRRISGHLSDLAIHISGSKDQTQDTDVFVPLGGSHTLSAIDPDDNTVDLFYYKNLNGIGEYTLAVLHLDRSPHDREAGRLHVGRTGGPGGDGPTDRHAHIELLKGKWTKFPKPSIRGPFRTNLSILCPR